ncbi:MAG: radical SAM protein [Candidatus Altiarchaeales archaeon]|nr:radical SAM protein [Candidatus Altiarchaeales archaeon]
MLYHTFHSDSENARKALANYFAILSGDRKPNFRACKQLSQKAVKARKVLEACMLCEHKCGVDRIKGERGFCRVLEPRIHSEFIHLGEETELVPSYTIFFAGCNFKCVFCQNWDISQNPDNGVELRPQMVARLVQSQHARNVNWVGGDPTPNLSFILEVLTHLEKNIPQVWNSNMYLTEESMKLLDGVIDVYLTDFKYGNDKCARRLSKIDNYLKVIQRNHILAGRQCEMIVRHLMLPGHYECCTKPVLEWLSSNFGSKVRVNLMDQYRPAYQAFKYEEINSLLPRGEHVKAKDYAVDLGLNLTD